MQGLRTVHCQVPSGTFELFFGESLESGGKEGWFHGALISFIPQLQIFFQSIALELLEPVCQENRKYLGV
jgi:hypothetical protein